MKSKICLLPMITPWVYDLLPLYRHYDKSMMIYAGGVYDQPNAYLEAMELIEDVLNG